MTNAAVGLSGDCKPVPGEPCPVLAVRLLPHEVPLELLGAPDFGAVRLLKHEYEYRLLGLTRNAVGWDQHPSTDPYNANSPLLLHNSLNRWGLSREQSVT